MTWDVLPWLGVREWGPVKHSGIEEIVTALSRAKPRPATGAAGGIDLAVQAIKRETDGIQAELLEVLGHIEGEIASALEEEES